MVMTHKRLVNIIEKEKESVKHEYVSKEQKETVVIDFYTTYLTRKSYSGMNKNLFSPYKRRNEYIGVVPMSIVSSLFKNG
jgi:hypothetical protein